MGYFAYYQYIRGILPDLKVYGEIELYPIVKGGWVGGGGGGSAINPSLNNIFSFKFIV